MSCLAVDFVIVLCPVLASFHPVDDSNLAERYGRVRAGHVLDQGVQILRLRAGDHLARLLGSAQPHNAHWCDTVTLCLVRRHITSFPPAAAPVPLSQAACAAAKGWA